MSLCGYVVVGYIAHKYMEKGANTMDTNKETQATTNTTTHIAEGCDTDYTIGNECGHADKL